MNKRTMRNKIVLSLLIGIVAAIAAVPAYMARAQVEEAAWSSPFRISGRDTKSTEATLIADNFGYVHVFWGEILDDDRSIVKYSRYDGAVWSVPISIYIGPADFTFDSISPMIGSDGRLYVYWSEGIVLKNIRIASAPIQDTLSAQAWAQPSRIQVLVKDMRVVEDSQGRHHLIFNRIDAFGRGLYYMVSTDKGGTWSAPVWLDPDLPKGLTPSNLNLAIDAADNLHIVWGYEILDILTSESNWIRYGRMEAATGNWTTTTIDRIDPEDVAIEYKLTAAGPVLALSGNQVVVIWAGGTLHYRHFRYSSDGGLTWSSPVRLFGGLNGQAFDGMTVDATGRIHYFAQIRFPTAIYHSIWDGTRWTSPSTVYFIKYSGDDQEPTDKIQAHAVHPAIRAGNQIVLTFTDEPPNPKRGVYVMMMTMTDVDPAPVDTPPPSLPTATPLPVPTEPAAITGTPQTTPTTGPVGTVTNDPIRTTEDSGLTTASESSPNSNNALIIGMLLSMLVLGIIITARIFARR
jgi:hypothetical protein